MAVLISHRFRTVHIPSRILATENRQFVKINRHEDLPASGQERGGRRAL